MELAKLERENFVNYLNLIKQKFFLANQKNSPTDLVKELETIEKQENEINEKMIDLEIALTKEENELKKINKNIAYFKARLATEKEKEVLSKEAKYEITTLRRKIKDIELQFRELSQGEVSHREELGNFAQQLMQLKNKSAELEAEITNFNTLAGVQLKDLEAEISHLEQSINPDLLAEYQEIRTKNGLGAGVLMNGICTACGMHLGEKEIDHLRSLSKHTITNCPECESILVRL